ncbi:hypothetical protein ACFQ60_43500 [Streptomyces zhihengii]
MTSGSRPDPGAQQRSLIDAVVICFDAYARVREGATASSTPRTPASATNSARTRICSVPSPACATARRPERNRREGQGTRAAVRAACRRMRDR